MKITCVDKYKKKKNKVIITKPRLHHNIVIYIYKKREREREIFNLMLEALNFF